MPEPQPQMRGARSGHQMVKQQARKEQHLGSCFSKSEGHGTRSMSYQQIAWMDGQKVVGTNMGGMDNAWQYTVVWQVCL